MTTKKSDYLKALIEEQKEAVKQASPSPAETPDNVEHKSGRPRTRPYDPDKEDKYEYGRRMARLRYRNLRAKGICVSCGKNKASRWSVYCDECREKVRERLAKKDDD